jgi:hypothetical protein
LHGINVSSACSVCRRRDEEDCLRRGGKSRRSLPQARSNSPPGSFMSPEVTPLRAVTAALCRRACARLSVPRQRRPHQHGDVWTLRVKKPCLGHRRHRAPRLNDGVSTRALCHRFTKFLRRPWRLGTPSPCKLGGSRFTCRFPHAPLDRGCTGRPNVRRTRTRADVKQQARGWAMAEDKYGPHRHVAR